MAKIFYIENRHTIPLVKELNRRGMSKNLFRPVSNGYIAFANIEDYNILIWGSGWNHGLSYHFSPKEEFFKSVDDAHDDSNEKFPYFARFNNHNYMTSRLQNCRGIEFNGPLGTNRYFGKGNGCKVHKSTDLDVLRNFPAYCSFQTDSEKTLEELSNDFFLLLLQNDVVRFDIGGLVMPSAAASIYYDLNGFENARDPKVFRYAADCYEEMIRLYMNHADMKKPKTFI